MVNVPSVSGSDAAVGDSTHTADGGASWSDEPLAGDEAAPSPIGPIAGAAADAVAAPAGPIAASPQDAGVASTDEASCPAHPPANLSTCPLSGVACDYDTASCVCLAARWQCAAGAPDAGAAVDAGTGPAADPACPAVPPTDDTDCPERGLRCEYDDGRCSCALDQKWHC
jgi:hypothetical protein